MEIKYFDDFKYSLNEGNSYKKEYGIIGPFPQWGYKIKATCPERGGKLSDNQIIVSGIDSADQILTLKYIYGEGKESDALKIPIGSFIIEGNDNNPILQTKKNIKWFDDEKNQNQFDEFIDSFLESKHFFLEENNIEDDIYSIIDIFEIEADISDINKKKDLFWIVKLDDGSEIEIKKRDKDNFFKTLKLYFSKDLYSPDIELSHEKPGYSVLYKTPKGVFPRKCQKISDINNDPIHKYLFSISSGKDYSSYINPVLDYLNLILKKHDWRPLDKSGINKLSEEELEINNIMKILTNSIQESDIDEIYKKAREKYTTSKK